MTIRPEPPDTPESRDQTALPSDQRSLDPIGLIDRILSSWPYLLRLIVLVIVVTALITGCLWLLNAGLTIGPVQISPQRSLWL